MKRLNGRLEFGARRQERGLAGMEGGRWERGGPGVSALGGERGVARRGSGLARVESIGLGFRVGVNLTLGLGLGLG